MLRGQHVCIVRGRTIFEELLGEIDGLFQRLDLIGARPLLIERCPVHQETIGYLGPGSQQRLLIGPKRLPLLRLCDVQARLILPLIEDGLGEAADDIVKDRIDKEVLIVKLE